MWTDKDTVLAQVRRFMDVSCAVPGPPALFQVVARPLLLPTAHTRPTHSTPPSSFHTAATLPSALERANRGEGIARMKGLARSYVWWPSMDAHLEAKVRACAECQASRPPPASAPLHPWEWPQKPWSRLHLDYAGSFLNRMFLVLVDAHSKWLEVIPVSAATSMVTIEKL